MKVDKYSNHMYCLINTNNIIGQHQALQQRKNKIMMLIPTKEHMSDLVNLVSDKKYMDLAEALPQAFAWSETKQGTYYWAEVQADLHSYYRQDNDMNEHREDEIMLALLDVEVVP